MLGVRVAPIGLASMLSFCAMQAIAGDAIPAPNPEVRIEDVARFYRVYDAANGHPTAEELQRDYLDPGSAGLHHLAKIRHVTGEAIAKENAAHPDVYENARRCMKVLPRVRERTLATLKRLATLYPPAVFPPVTIAVSRGKPVGVGDDTGVMIGLEALCAVTWLEPDVENRFVHIIAHEFVHVQQANASPAFYANEHPTVLEESLIEGAAEFVGEQISGSVSYRFLQHSTRGRRSEIETAFVADEDKTDLSDWLYNGSMTKPGDLGYWVGYRIVKSYDRHAVDKRRAIAEIIGMSDAKAFLARSGWHPGIRLDRRLQ